MADTSIIKKLRISRIIDETANTKTFVLEPLANWIPEYKAGQFLTLIFRTKHGEKRRSYSISSSSLWHEALSITVKKVDNGEFSRFMLSHLKVGNVIESSGISGLFVLPETIDSSMNFCFIAAGSGIVPCYAIIKNLLRSSHNRIKLIYSNKNETETIFYKNLLQMQNEYKDRFEIRFLFSNSKDILQRRLGRWLLEQVLEQQGLKPSDKNRFYICGPFEYMQTVEITLRSFAPRENIIKENFSSLPRLIIPQPPDTKSHQVTIRIKDSEHILNVQYPKSILATAKSKGIELPYSCEAGRCSSCIATCSKGKVWMAYNEVLVDKEIEKGRVLVCQSFPIEGDVEIVYD